MAGLIETPYLQLVLQRVWEVEHERGSKVLRLETFRDLGGAQQIVEDHLERALQALSPAEQDAAANVFGHLVTPSGTKIAHGVADLATYAAVGESELEPVLRSLASQRILRPLGENGHAGGRYEIFHDVLAEAVVAWRVRHEAEGTIAREREAARRRQRRLAWVAAAALVGLTLMTGLAAYAFTQRGEARRQAFLASTQKAAAERSAQTAKDSAAGAKKAQTEALQQARVAEKQRQRADDALDAANDAARRAQKLQLKADEAADYATVLLGQKSVQATRAQDARDRADELAKQAQAALHIAQTARDKSKKDEAKAVASRKRAEARQFVALSLAALGTDPEKSVKFALRASDLEKGSDQQTEDVLRAALVAMHVEHVLPGARRGPNSALAARFSGDGGRIVVGGGSREVRVYGSDGALVRRFRADSTVSDVALNRDGRLVAAGGKDGRASIWDVDSRTLVHSVEHGAPVAGVAWSPAEDVLVTVGGGPTPSARLWDAASGDRLQLLPHEQTLAKASFSSDGRRLVTVGTGRVAHVFDVRTGIPLATLENPNGGMTSAAFGPHGDVVVTGSRDRVARVWDVETGVSMLTLAGHTGQVLDVAFSPDGQFIATASYDSLARIWNAQTGLPVDVLHDHGGPPVVDVDFARSDSSWAVVTAGADGTARYWAPGQQPVVLLGHKRGVLAASFSPDGQRILTASTDGDARLWDPHGDRRLRELTRLPRTVSAVAVNASGSKIASGGNDGTVRVTSQSGKTLRSRQLGQQVTSVGWGGRDRLLVATRDGVARVWDDQGRPLGVVDHGGRIRAAALSRDGTLVATAGQDGVVRLWRVAGSVSLHTLRGDPGAGAVTSVAFAPNGRIMASAAGHNAYLWQVGTGHRLGAPLAGHSETVTGVAFDPRSRLLATSSADRDARLWDVKTRDSTPLIGHGGTVVGSAFSADSRWLATAGPRKAGLWQVRKSPLPRHFLFFLTGHSNALTSVAFSPRKWTVVTGSLDGTVRSYSCYFCGRLPQLRALAKARLDRLTAERKR